MRLIDAIPLSERIELSRQSTDQEYELDYCWAEGFNAGLDCALHCIAYAETITQPPNVPLTLEELREMALRCEGVYIAHTDGSPVFRGQSYCAAVLDCRPAFGSTTMHIQAIYGDRLTMWEDEYDKTWLAYRRKPEEGTT